MKANPLVLFGAQGGTRTRTALRPGDFKSPVSTGSTTQASGGVAVVKYIPSLAAFRKALSGHGD